jgi:hypothetical protein
MVGQGLFATISALITHVFKDLNKFTLSFGFLIKQNHIVLIDSCLRAKLKFWCKKYFYCSRRECLIRQLLVKAREQKGRICSSIEFVINFTQQRSFEFLKAIVYYQWMEKNLSKIKKNLCKTCIETGDILIIHQAIGGFPQPQDDNGTSSGWSLGIRPARLMYVIYVVYYRYVCMHAFMYAYIKTTDI